MRSQRLTTSLALIALLLSCCAVAPGHAQAKHARHLTWPGWLPGDPEPTTTASTPIWMPVVKTTKGLYIAIDPVTHRPIAPTPEQIRAWSDQRARDALTAPTRPLMVERLPQGGEIIHLNGAYRSYSIARRDSQGRITTDCAPDARTAKQLLSTPAREER